MIPTGKYYAPIAIEVIGSASRIWGLCIRFFEQANIQEKCTFIYNPYYDLLAPLIRQSPAERKKFLLTQLVEGSVGKTYKILQKNKLENTMIHIKSFWNLIGFWFTYVNMICDLDRIIFKYVTVSNSLANVWAKLELRCISSHQVQLWILVSYVLHLAADMVMTLIQAHTFHQFWIHVVWMSVNWIVDQLVAAQNITLS